MGVFYCGPKFLTAELKGHIADIKHSGGHVGIDISFLEGEHVRILYT